MLFGLFLIFGAIFTGVRGWIAFASGGVATATVHGESGDQRHRRNEVTFTTRDGTTASDLTNTTISVPLVLLAGGLFFLLFIPATLGSAEPVEEDPATAPDARNRNRAARRRRHEAGHPGTRPPEQG